MTHPIYSQTTLEALTISQVKAIAKSLGSIPDGDKRVKQTWVSAVLDHQIKFSPAKVEAMSAHIAEVMNRAKEVPQDLIEEPIPVDSYISSPRTHADDVAFAASMGLTYDDVFGDAPEPIAEEEMVGVAMGDEYALVPKYEVESPSTPEATRDTALVNSPVLVVVAFIVALVAIVRGIALLTRHTILVGEAIAKHFIGRLSVNRQPQPA